MKRDGSKDRGGDDVPGIRQICVRDALIVQFSDSRFVTFAACVPIDFSIDDIGLVPGTQPVCEIHQMGTGDRSNGGYSCEDAGYRRV